MTGEHYGPRATLSSGLWLGSSASTGVSCVYQAQGTIGAGSQPTWWEQMSGCRAPGGAQTLPATWLSSEGVWVLELTRAAMQRLRPPHLSPSSRVDLCLGTGPEGQDRCGHCCLSSTPWTALGCWRAGSLERLGSRRAWGGD